jgi:hypothetical protein
MEQSFILFFLEVFKEFKVVKSIKKLYNILNKIGKLRETVGRKAIGPLKWQPVALIH